MHKPNDNWKSRAVLFLLSQSVSLFGSTLVQMAIVWYVTLETASGGWVAVFTICSYLPQFLISFWGGVWADRYHRKALIIGADAMIAAVTLLLMLFLPYLQGRAFLLPVILAVSTIRSLGSGIQTPAGNAVIPLLVPETQRMRFNGVYAAMQAAIQFAAPAAAGIILSLSSLRISLLTDVVTALLGIGLLAGLRLPPQEQSRSTATYFSDVKTGLRYALSHRPLVRVLILYGLFIFFAVPGGFLAQLLVSRVFESSYWYLTAAELAGFAGMTAGGLILGAWGGFRRRETTLALGLASFGLLSVGMGLAKRFPLYLALMALYGIAMTIVQTSVTTIIQDQAERAVHGRIFGLMSTLYAGALPLGMAIFGPLADVVPIQVIVVLSGIALLLTAPASQPIFGRF